MQTLFARANKRREELAKEQKPAKDRCPYTHRPRCGMFVGDITEGHQPHTATSPPVPLPCTRVALEAKCDEEFGTFTQKMCFVFGGKDVPAKGIASIIIPVSEFGKLEQFDCKVNGIKIQGDVLRRDADSDDSYYWNARRPLSEKEKQEQVEKQKRQKILGEEPLHDVFYFVGRHLCEQLNETEDKFSSGKLFEVELTVKVGIFKDAKGRYTLIYPMTAAPKLSFQDFSVAFTMSRSVRQILPLNKGPIVHTAIRGRRAKAVVEIQGDRVFKPTDHLFGFAVELGEPIVPQCADPVAIFVLVTFIGAMIFLTLTQNIMDDDF